MLTKEMIEGMKEQASQYPAIKPMDDGKYGIMCLPEDEDLVRSCGVHVMEWYEVEPGLKKMRIKP